MKQRQISTLLLVYFGLSPPPSPPLTPFHPSNPNTLCNTLPNKPSLLQVVSNWAMVHPRLARCMREAVSYSRTVHTRSGLDSASIAHLLDNGPKDATNVVINGFVRSIRNQKQRSFASIGDGSSIQPLQALLTPSQAQRYGLQGFRCASHHADLNIWQFIHWHSCADEGIMAAFTESASPKS